MATNHLGEQSREFKGGLASILEFEVLGRSVEIPSPEVLVRSPSRQRQTLGSDTGKEMVLLIRARVGSVKIGIRIDGK
jgi:hypothetical protein